MRFIKKYIYFFLFIVSLIINSSCSSEKLVQPELKDFSVEGIKLNEEGKIELKLNIKVFNPNNKDFSLTLSSLSVFKEEKLIGHLADKSRFELLKKEDTNLNFYLVIEDRGIITTIYNFLVSRKIVITFRGDLIYHHALGNFNFKFEEEKTINLEDVFF